MLRPLSLLELYELSRSLLAPPIYGNVTEFLLLSAPSPFKPSRFIDSLKCALPLLCAQYPALLATISEPHSKQPYWTWLEHVQWDEVIVEKRLRNLEQSTVEKVMGVECDTAIDPTQGKVLWRFIVGYEELADDSSKTCPSFLLGLVFNHCPMDGTAAMHVLGALVRILNNPATPSSHPPTLFLPSEARPTTLPEPFENRTQITPTFLKALPHLLPTFRKPTYWAGTTPATHTKHDTVLRTLVLPLPQLLTLTKQQNTTIHAALHTLLFQTLSTILGEGITLRMGTPINTRPYCDKGDTVHVNKELGAFISMVVKDYASKQLDSTTEFWAEARNFRDALIAAIDESILMVILLKYLPFPNKVTQWYLQPIKSCPGGRRESTVFSNLGRFPYAGGDGGFEVELVWFGQSVLVTGHTLGVNAISVGDKCFMTVIWQKGAVGEEFWNAFVDAWWKVWEKVVDVV